MALESYIVLYFVFVLLLIWRLGAQKKRYARYLHDFERELDRWWFLYTRTLYTNKQGIFEYKDHVDVLFANQKRILQDKQKSYVKFYDLFKQDLRYIEDLLGDALISQKDLKKSDKLYRRLLSVRRAHTITNFLLLVCTAGLFSIWRMPLMD